MLSVESFSRYGWESSNRETIPYSGSKDSTWLSLFNLIIWSLREMEKVYKVRLI